MGIFFSSRMGKYKREPGARKYADCKPETLTAALDAMKDGMNVSEASRTFGICRRTLYNKLKKVSDKKYGRPTIFSEKEEESSSENESSSSGDDTQEERQNSDEEDANELPEVENARSQALISPSLRYLIKSLYRVLFTDHSW